VTKVEAIAKKKNAIPPIITGLNFIKSPDIIVETPIINKKIGGGGISSLIERNTKTGIEEPVTFHR
jgi:hypothetical protein